MLIVEVKYNNIDRALKLMRRKIIQTKQLKKLRENKTYNKPSDVKREKVLKAQYVQRKKDQEEY
mgnify:FL=1|tara:strand:+ start:2477 stop:2668 length:192 start_codon:yes stop_codon:yes gene_type:complete